MSLPTKKLLLIGLVLGGMMASATAATFDGEAAKEIMPSLRSCTNVSSIDDVIGVIGSNNLILDDYLLNKTSSMTDAKRQEFFNTPDIKEFVIFATTQNYKCAQKMSELN